MHKPRKVGGFSFAWAVVTGFFLLLLLLLDIRVQKGSLHLETSVVYDYSYERALINEVILHNFVELVENNSNDLSALRRYATDMRDHYPHILRFRLLQHVDETDITRLVERMRGLGFDSFNVFTPPGSPQEAKSNTQQFYPTIFVEPLDMAGEALMGEDAFSVTGNRRALQQAAYYLDVFASDPYKEEGEIGYRLFHATDPADLLESADALYVAVIDLRANDLLPPSQQLSEGMRVSLYDGGGHLLLRREALAAAGWNAWLLPRLEEVRTINRFGQVLEIIVSRQLLWTQLNWPMAGVVLLFSLFSFVLTRRSYKRRLDAEQELVHLNEKLRAERDLLEDRVQERTWEMVKTNSELRRQVKENRSLTQKVLHIQEEERRNIARELHDEMGQSLTAIRTDAHLLRQLTSKDTKSLVHQAATAIDQTAQRIYGVTYGMMRALRPSALDDLGLVDAIKGCVASFHLESKQIVLTSSFKGPVNELPEAINICVYRLVQEAINNSLKHARATKISLEIHHDEAAGNLSLLFRDNGCGFEWRSVQGGFGLIGMRERVLALGGSFTVNSAAGEGTRIEVFLPAEQPQNLQRMEH